MRKPAIIATALLAATAALGTAGSIALADNGNGGGSGAGLANGDACYTAVYDQQNGDGTYAHYGKGEWDAERQLCMHVKSFTQSFLPNVGAIEAATNNPFIHVMYVIDRTKARIYAPCGANSDSGAVSSGVLAPGTYDLNTLTQVDSTVPNLGAGANCLITG